MAAVAQLTPLGRPVGLLPSPKPPSTRLGMKFRPSLIILGLVLGIRDLGLACAESRV
jgi:hypothetical protein